MTDTRDAEYDTSLVRAAIEQIGGLRDDDPDLLAGYSGGDSDPELSEAMAAGMGAEMAADEGGAVTARDNVIAELLRCPEGRHFAYDLGKAAKSRPWPVYRTLNQLLASGLVEDGWEDKPQHPRRWYRLTDKGRTELGWRG